MFPLSELTGLLLYCSGNSQAFSVTLVYFLMLSLFFFCNVWATLMAILYVTLKGCQDGDQMISYSYQISLRCPLLFCLGSSWFEWSNVQVLLIKSFGAICICILGLFGNVFLNFFLTLSAPNLVVMSGGYQPWIGLELTG